MLMFLSLKTVFIPNVFTCNWGTGEGWVTWKSGPQGGWVTGRGGPHGGVGHREE